MLNILDIGASGLLAQRTRLDTISQNLANTNTIADANGKNNPYKRRFVIMAPGQPGDPNKPGVRVKEIGIDQSFKTVLEPSNPLRDAQGNVKYPNIDMSTEFVNALEASRAYEANVTMMETTKAMFGASMRILA